MHHNVNNSNGGDKPCAQSKERWRRLASQSQNNSSNDRDESLLARQSSRRRKEGKAAGRLTGFASCTLSTHFPSAANSHCDPSCITDGLGSAFVRAMYVSEP